MKPNYLVLQLVIVITFWSSIIRAQTNTIEWGNSFDGNVFGTSIDLNTSFMGKDSKTESTFWLTKFIISTQFYSDNRNFILKKFDSTNTLIFSKDLHLLDFPEKSDSVVLKTEKIVQLKDKFILLVSAFNKKKSKETFYLHEMNFDGQLTKNSQLVSIVKTKKDKMDQNFLVLSPDSTKIIACVQGFEDSRTYHLLITDTNLSPLHSKLFKQQKDEFAQFYQAESHTQLYIDNAKRVYFLTDNYMDKDKRFRVVLFRYHPVTDSLNESKLDAGENNVIESVLLRIDKTNTPSILGLYKHQTDTKQKGFLYISFNNHLTIVNTKIKQFSTPFIIAEKTTAIEKKDGGIILLNEYKDAINGYSGNINILNIDKEGNLLYHFTVYKKQRLSNISNYCPLYNVSTNTLHIIFNDNSKNVSINNKKGMSNMKDKSATPMLLSIDAKGDMTKKYLFENYNKNITLCPNVFFQSSDKEVYLFGEAGIYKYKLGRLTIQ
ncbi:MAG TPA: hypothetical protein VK766_08130 [Cytophagaceae bacterium]|jgi:hypothetical protein|nr:hypothetical protein [Cytophagaceae bacterium]